MTGNGNSGGQWPAGSNEAGRIGNGGNPLPDATRSALEARLGCDLSDVRVMTNSAVARAVGAQAFTSGTDIHFATGAYQPNTSEGRELLAHELTHVVQQRNAL